MGRVVGQVDLEYSRHKSEKENRTQNAENKENKEEEKSSPEVKKNKKIGFDLPGFLVLSALIHNDGNPESLFEKTSMLVSEHKNNPAELIRGGDFFNSEYPRYALLEDWRREFSLFKKLAPTADALDLACSPEDIARLPYPI